MKQMQMQTGSRAPVSRAMRAVKTVPSTVTSAAKQGEIYIGFPKGDYDRAPGRKGRVIKDDPAKYPDKEDIGFIAGATGGWAGGEVGLWQIRDQVKKESAKQKASKPAAATTRKQVVNPKGEEIYVGFGKDELDLRKSGAKGRVLVDEPFKYPGKEDVGPILGAVGGFAGGERALKAFAETGELKLRKPGEPGPKQPPSPLALAFLAIFLLTGGGFVVADINKRTGILSGLTGSAAPVEAVAAAPKAAPAPAPAAAPAPAVAAAN